MDDSISTCSSKDIDNDVVIIAFGGNYTKAILLAIVLVPESVDLLINIYLKELNALADGRSLYFLSVEEAFENKPILYTERLKLFCLECRDTVITNINSITVGIVVGAVILNIAYERYLNG